MRHFCVDHAALAIVLLLAAIGTSAQDAKPPVLDPALMNRAADIAYSRAVDRARAKRALDVNAALVSTVRRTSAPLIAYASTLEPAAASWSWTLHVETRDEPIAYCLPGGRIMLSTGLVDRMKLTPPELAVVLAHVITHALMGHEAAEAAARLATLGDAPDPNRRLLQLADILGKLVLYDSHDKEAERAADAITLEFMARAGVDPRPAVDTWRKIARAGGATPPGFLGLHPTWPGRLDEIETQMPRVLPSFEQAQAELAARPQAPTTKTVPGPD